jgi:hypothetical protein
MGRASSSDAAKAAGMRSPGPKEGAPNRAEELRRLGTMAPGRVKKGWDSMASRVGRQVGSVCTTNNHEQQRVWGASLVWWPGRSDWVACKVMARARARHGPPSVQCKASGTLCPRPQTRRRSLGNGCAAMGRMHVPGLARDGCGMQGTPSVENIHTAPVGCSQSSSWHRRR